MATYEGEIVHNGDYRVRKLAKQIRAMEEQHARETANLQEIISHHENKIEELKATIKRFINNGIRIPKGRPRNEQRQNQPERTAQ